LCVDVFNLKLLDASTSVTFLFESSALALSTKAEESIIIRANILILAIYKLHVNGGL
jgi:hypothetical protein